MREAPAAAPSVNRALGDAAQRLTAAGVQSPRLDAELLLAEALGVGRAELVVRASAAVEPDALKRFDALVRRRAQREPVAYILGRKPFRHIELAVDPRVLIPRPETELLVEVGSGLPAAASVVDVGTGSGAVALALKQERPDLQILACDISADALAVARANAARLGLAVEFIQSDLLAGVKGDCHAVLANLPYVADGSELAPEISRHEPSGALFAGSDGLDQIRRLVGQLDRVPVTALEIGFDQAQAVSELLQAVGFRRIERLRDLAGHERVLVGRR